MANSRRLVFTTFGSLGDLHPFLAMAIEWQRRGNIAVIATSESYRPVVEAEGLLFAPVRPDLPEGSSKADVMRRIMDRSDGPQYLLRDVVVPQVRESFDDLMVACDGADGIVGHPLTFAVPLVAHLKKIPWAYVIIAPTVILSAYDPPHLAPSPWVSNLRRMGPGVHRMLFKLVKFRIFGWFTEVRKLSRELGVYPVAHDPMGADQFSPYLNLALFSSVLASPRPDWPDHTAVTGFTFYDRQTGQPGLSRELEQFLEAGTPPLVFTLGSAAVMDARDFYVLSARAAALLNRRAVLLIGRDAGNHSDLGPPETVHVSEYASFTELFPRCAVIVHHGGVGTTAQAMRSGRPMLVMPYAFDQPDNAARIVRLGLGRTISREKYTAQSAAAEIGKILDDPTYAKRAAVVSRLIRMEDGPKAACDSIESKLLQTPCTITGFSLTTV